MQLKLASGDEHRTSSTLGNIALVMMRSENYEGAIGYFKRASAIAEKYEIHNAIHRNRLRLAWAYIREKSQLDEAETLLLNSIEYFEGEKIQHYVREGVSHLTELYEIKGEIDLAIQFAHQYLDMVKDVNKSYYQTNSIVLARLYIKKQEFTIIFVKTLIVTSLNNK